MSKKQQHTKKEITFEHVVEKESGGRGTYFDMTDEMTTFGTGRAELIFRANGFVNMEGKKHWKKGNRPFGGRRDIGTNQSQWADAFLYNTGDRVEMETTPELLELNRRWWEECSLPNVHALQDLRKNPTLKRARKTAEVYANELAHYGKNHKELLKLVATQNAGTLEFVDDSMKDQMVEAFAQQFLASRKSKLEAMKKS